MPKHLTVFLLATIAFFALPMAYLYGLSYGKAAEDAAYRNLLESRLTPACYDRLVSVEENPRSGERWDAKLHR